MVPSIFVHKCWNNRLTNFQNMFSIRLYLITAVCPQVVQCKELHKSDRQVCENTWPPTNFSDPQDRFSERKKIMLQINEMLVFTMAYGISSLSLY